MKALENGGRDGLGWVQMKWAGCGIDGVAWVGWVLRFYAQIRIARLSSSPHPFVSSLHLPSFPSPPSYYSIPFLFEWPSSLERRHASTDKITTSSLVATYPSTGNELRHLQCSSTSERRTTPSLVAGAFHIRHTSKPESPRTLGQERHAYTGLRSVCPLVFPFARPTALRPRIASGPRSFKSRALRSRI